MNIQCPFHRRVSAKSSVLILLLVASALYSNAQYAWVWFQNAAVDCYQSNNAVRSICECDGKIWVTKNHQVMAMDTATGEYEIYDQSDFPPFEYGEFASINTNGTDRIYVGYGGCHNEKKGLLQFDGTIWQNFPCDPLNTIDWVGMPLQVASTGHVFTAVKNQVAEFDGLYWSIHTSPAGNIYCGGMDAADSIWLGTIVSGNLISYYNDSFQSELANSSPFYTTAVSKQGEVYLPSWFNNAGIIIRFNHGALDTIDFPWSQFVTYSSPMVTDTSGNLIMVNQEVVYFLQGQDWIPEYLPVNFGEHSAVYCDQVNNVWIGYSNGMLVRLRDGQSTIFNLSYSALPSDSVLALSSYNNFSSGYQTLAGTPNGLAIIDIDDLSVTKVYNQNNSILTSDRINCLSKETNFTPIPTQWIGTNTGLYSWDFDTTWHHYSTQNSPLPNDTINSVVLSTYNGGIWIGTNGGLAYFEEDTVWMVFTNQNSALPSNKIQCLHYNEPILSIGTDSGAVIYDGSIWQVLKTTNSGIPSSDITAIARPYFGLFIGTRSGGFCDSMFSTSSWAYLNSSTGFGSDSIISIYDRWEWIQPAVFIGTIGGGMNTVFTDGSFNSENLVQGIEFNNAYDVSLNESFGPGVKKWVGTEKGMLLIELYWGIGVDPDQPFRAVAYFDPHSLNIRADWSQFESPEIQMFDLQGRFLFSYHPGRLDDQQLVSIPATNLSVQIYLIRIQSGNSSITLKAFKLE